MYRGLLHQATFVCNTESSDVTEVFITNKGARKFYNERSPQSANDAATAGCSKRTVVSTFGPRRETQLLLTRRESDVSKKADHQLEANSHVRFEEKPTQTDHHDFSRISEQQIASLEPDRGCLFIPKQYFIFRPSSQLLNAWQYSKYLQTVPDDHLHGQICQAPPNSENSSCYLTRSSRTSSAASSRNSTCIAPPVATTLNSKVVEKCQAECHVVGDLLSFASNTMRYFDNADLSDLILLVGESRFYAHKFALAAQSDVFRDMLIVSERCSSCPDFQKELELDESNECQLVFMDFLRFFYCGRISFSPDTALPLLVLAAKYRVEALRSACDAYISGMIEDGDLKNAVKWLRYAGRFQLHDLTGKCVDGAISDNMEELVDSHEWLSLSSSCVEVILKSSCLLVPDEFYLYEALQRWIMSKRKSEEDDVILEDDLAKTLQHIRFSQMEGPQLLAVEESNLGRSFKEVVRSFLSDAYRYQILARESCEFQEDHYLPRDYTNKNHCVQLMYHPSRHKKSAPSVFYGKGKWEIQPRRYYDTLNVVIILKKPLETDVKVYVSILIYKRSGGIQMRLRRKACVLRALDMSMRNNALAGGVTTPIPGAAGGQRGTAHGSTPGGANQETPACAQPHRFPNAPAANPHRSPHGPASKLHGPHNGQEYYAIDNIISDTDFQAAIAQSGANGLKLGVIIRTWGVNAGSV